MLATPFLAAFKVLRVFLVALMWPVWTFLAFLTALRAFVRRRVGVSVFFLAHSCLYSSVLLPYLAMHSQTVSLKHDWTLLRQRPPRVSPFSAQFPFNSELAIYHYQGLSIL